MTVTAFSNEDDRFVLDWIMLEEAIREVPRKTQEDRIIGMKYSVSLKLAQEYPHGTPPTTLGVSGDLAITKCVATEGNSAVVYERRRMI